MKRIFIDLSSAYNSVNRAKLLDIIKSKNPDKRIIDYMKEWFDNSTINIGGELYRTSTGVPQGSSLWPYLFNVYLDHCLEQAISNHAGLHEIIAYADDLVIVVPKRFQLDWLIVTLNEYNMKINLENKKCMLGSTKGIQTISSFKYVGVSISNRLKPWGLGSIRKE